MKKVCLAVLPALTIVLELLPLGAVCIFFIEEERCSQSIVCPFHYYGSYFSFAIDVWLKLLYPCRSPYNSNTCNRKYFG